MKLLTTAVIAIALLVSMFLGRQYMGFIDLALR